MPEPKDPQWIRTDLLSIDAWRDPDGGWQWNAWHTLEAGIYWHEHALTPRRVLAKLREWGYLSDYSKGRMSCDDDGYNFVICRRGTREPVLALAYGPYIEHYAYRDMSPQLSQRRPSRAAITGEPQ